MSIISVCKLWKLGPQLYVEDDNTMHMSSRTYSDCVGLKQQAEIPPVFAHGSHTQTKGSGE